MLPQAFFGDLPCVSQVVVLPAQGDQVLYHVVSPGASGIDVVFV